MMHGPITDQVEVKVPATSNPLVAALGRALDLCNRVIVILAVGLELEAFGKKGAQDDDVEVAKVYEKAGAKVVPLDVATVGKWRDIARDTAWKDYSAKTATAASLLKLASDVSA